MQVNIDLINRTWESIQGFGHVDEGVRVSWVAFVPSRKRNGTNPNSKLTWIKIDFADVCFSNSQSEKVVYRRRDKYLFMAAIEKKVKRFKSQLKSQEEKLAALATEEMASNNNDHGRSVLATAADAAEEG